MPLIDLLRSEIRTQGSIGLDRYMELALSHPEHGYYMRQDPFGIQGDFITAPEISQCFGELIGLWCASIWHNMGPPDTTALIELGPGRGTLANDALRAGTTVPGFTDSLQLHLMEISPILQAIQHNTLAQHVSTPTWHTSLDTLPDLPSILIANEFFDALPVRQYEFSDGQWHERRLTLDASDNLEVTLTPSMPPPDTTTPSNAPEGSILEIIPALPATLGTLAQRFLKQGGALLIIDYGYTDSAFGDTLQAVKKHAYHPILKDPGSADLTTHVNFAHIAALARRNGLDVHGPVTQREFLSRLGIGERLEHLLKNATPTQQPILISGVERLISPAHMGDLFKVIALTQPGLPEPPGFCRNT